MVFAQVHNATLNGTHITVPHYGAYITKKNLVEIMYPPYHPWEWYIFTYIWWIFMGNVDKYTIHSCMDATG